MINVSQEFRQCMAEDHRKFLAYLDIRLREGTVLRNLDDSDLWEGGFKLNDSVTTDGQFTVGSCISNKLTITLNNIYDKFSAYDFNEAMVTAYLGLEVSPGKIEKIRKGVFTVDDAQYDGTTITLECLDYMSKFDVDYANVKTTYPAALRTIVKDICDYCHMTFHTPEFENNSYIVEERPEDDTLTCRQMLAYCAQLACCFGRCDTYGRLEFRWFNTAFFEESDSLDGQFFDDGTPSYISGDAADGGTFDDYSVGCQADGGTFDDLKKFHHLYSMSSFKATTDDVVITGVEVTEEFAETEKKKKETVLYGYKGYVLSVSGNKLIQAGRARKAAEYLGRKLVGLKFRPMSAQVLSDPTVEAGDLAYVTDRRQNTYNCLITNLAFHIGGFMDVSCDAETPGKNSAKQYTEMTHAVVEARKNTQAQIYEYDEAVQSLADLIMQSFGIYRTTEKQEDGSVVYYMHEKAALAESRIIWKMTADQFAVSTDGGTTWNAGVDSSGNVVVNVLSAIGIHCDWIRAGTLTLGGYYNQRGKLVVQDAEGNEMGSWTNNGIQSTGRITSDNATDNYAVEMYNGELRIYGADGTLQGKLMHRWEGEKQGIQLCSSIKQKFTYIILDEDGIISLMGAGIKFAGDLYASGNQGRTGKAEFSDGSYLEFTNGILTGGQTAGGSTF